MLPFFYTNKARLFVLTLAHVVIDMYVGFVAPLQIVLTEITKTPKWKMAILVGVCGVVVNVVQPFAGWICHRFKNPYILILSPLLALTLSFMGLTSNFAIVVAIAIVAHISVGFFHPEALLATQEVSGEKDHIGVPLFISGGFFGYSIGSYIAPQWYTAFEYSLNYFWLLAVPAILVMAACFITGIHRLELHAPKTIHDESNGVNFAELLLWGMLLAIPISVIYFVIMPYMKIKFGLNDALVWGKYTFPVLGLISAFTSYVWGYAGRRISPFLIVGCGQILMAFFLYLLIIAETPQVIVWLCVPVGIGMSFFPLVVTLSKKSVGYTKNVRAGMIVGVSWGTGALLVIAFGAWMKHGLGERDIMFSCLAPVIAAIVFSFYLYVKYGSNFNRQIE